MSKFKKGQIVLHIRGVIPYVIVESGINNEGRNYYRCITGGSDSGSPHFWEEDLRRPNRVERGLKP